METLLYIWYWLLWAFGASTAETRMEWIIISMLGTIGCIVMFFVRDD